MATPSTPQPSFSPRRKWSIAFSVTLATIAVFAILVGINYLSTKYFFKRIYLSGDTQVRLSPRTLSVLKGLTNDVEVTIYYLRDEPNSIYPDIVNLLQEYQARSSRVKVTTVDYLHQPDVAAALVAGLGMGSTTNKDFVIFNSGGHVGIVPGALLSAYKYDWQQSTDQDDAKLSVTRKRVAFNGEMLFTSQLFALTQAKPLTAYFLLGHGERSPTDTSEVQGAHKLAQVFHRNFIRTEKLDNLLGTNAVPLDCNLLVIDGPAGEFQPIELEKISQYLDQGGRLFALFDRYSVEHQIGLEKVLAKWNVRVTHETVRDRENATDQSGDWFGVGALTVHDVMKPILGKQLEMVLPRPIERIQAPASPGADEPLVTELAFSGTNSVLVGAPTAAPRGYPLMVAVEKGVPKGVATERGATRMLITGDSMFLDNQIIDFSVNEDFAESAVNWLLERTTLLEGLGPRPVMEYQILMNPGQLRAVNGLLLGAIPGGILLFGGLVWLRRRR